jgi:hypothetical protein
LWGVANLTKNSIKGPYGRVSKVINDIIDERREQIKLNGLASARKGKYELDFLDRLLETFNEDGSLVRKSPTIVPNCRQTYFFFFLFPTAGPQ